MPYPTEKNSPDSPPLNPQEMSPRQLMETAMAQTVMELMQLRRTLWLIVKQVGPVAVDESKAHPLWRLKATRLDSGQMHLQAMQFPDPTEAQLSQLIEMLNGSKTPLDDALAMTDLKDHPPNYVAFLLLPKISLRDDGQWVDTALLQTPTGNN